MKIPSLFWLLVIIIFWCFLVFFILGGCSKDQDCKMVYDVRTYYGSDPTFTKVIMTDTPWHGVTCAAELQKLRLIKDEYLKICATEETPMSYETWKIIILNN